MFGSTIDYSIRNLSLESFSKNNVPDNVPPDTWLKKLYIPTMTSYDRCHVIGVCWALIDDIGAYMYAYCLFSEGDSVL